MEAGLGIFVEEKRREKDVEVCLDGLRGRLRYCKSKNYLSLSTEFDGALEANGMVVQYFFSHQTVRSRPRMLRRELFLVECGVKMNDPHMISLVGSAGEKKRYRYEVAPDLVSIYHELLTTRAQI